MSQDTLIEVLGADGEPQALIIGGEVFAPPAHADEVLGFDDSGRWELGALPLLLAAPKAIQLALRVRQQRQQAGRPPVLRAMLDRFDRRRAPAVVPAPAQPHPGGAASRFFRGDPMNSEDLVMGALQRPRFRRPMGRPRCRLKKRGGRLIAYDPDNGEEVEVMGVDDEDFGADHGYFGADPEEALGADDDFLGGEEEDDELLGAAEDAADELYDGADQDDDASFAGKEERLQRRLNKLDARADRIRDKIADMRGPFKGLRRKKLNRRLKKLVKRANKLRAKLNKATNKRRKAVKAAGIAAAAVGAAAAGTAAAAMTPSRDGIREAEAMNDPLNNPLRQQELRRMQTQAGLVGQYRAPAGSGRLLPVPMTQDGTTNPRNALTVPAAGITSATTIFAEDLPYIVANMVGFISSQRGTDTTNGAIGLVADLKIRGSGPLFLHEDPAPADTYDTSIDRLMGLRAYQKVKSPNQAQVDIYAAGDNTDVVILTCHAIYDVLQDDSYGTGFPGAYG